jgi:hypothetical protein
MTTGEGADLGDSRDDNEDRHKRGARIGVGGGDESVTRIQLAARWAEAYSVGTDSLGGILKRFRAAYDYLDAVTHGVEPPDLERELLDTHPVSHEAATPAPSSVAPASYAPPAAPTPASE